MTTFDIEKMYAQSENVGIGTTTPDNSAVLHITFSNPVNPKGILIPKLTTTERNSITSPANGLIIFNTTTNAIEYNAGTSGTPAWSILFSSGNLTLADGHIFVGNGSNQATAVSPTGDVTISNTGVTTIANNAVTSAKIQADAVTSAKILDGTIVAADIATDAVNGTKISLTSEANGSMMYFNGTDWVNLAAGTNGQVLKLTGGIPAWTADNSLSSTLNNGQIFVGNISNIATGVTPSGDFTITNAGVATISNNAVTEAKLADNSVNTAELIDGSVTNSKMAANSVNTSEIIDGAVNSGDLADNSVITTKINDGAVTGAKLENSGVTANTYGSATQVPVVTVDAKGRVTGVTNTTITGTSPIGSALTSGNIIVGSGTNVAAAVSMSGDVTISNTGVTTIANDAITNAKLADNAVNTAEITDGAVSSAKILDGTIATGDIADGAVTGAKLENSGVTANTYGSATQVPVVTVDAKGRVTGVTNTTITGTSPIGSALTSGNIIVGSGTNVAAAVSMSGDVTISNTGVTTIANDAITNTKMADNSVGNAELLDNAVNTAEITDGAVSSAKILDGTIATGDIADGAVTGAKLENSGVTANTYGSATQVPVVTVDAKGRVTGVTNTTITGTSPIGSALTSGNIIVGSGTNVAAAVSMSGDVTISNTGVTTIASDAITNTKMADNSVGNAELLDNAVNTAEIVNGAVTDVKLATDAVTNAKIQDGAVTGAKLENSGVTASTYGSATQVPVVTVDAKGRVTGVTNTTITGTSPIGSALTSANIIVGNSSNEAAAVSMSGDVTITNAGVTTIANDAITNAKMADNSVGNAELLDNAVNTAEIVNGAVTDVKLADNSVITAKINDGAVTGAKLENSGVTANTYGSATQVPVVTVDAKGRVTGVTNTTITGTSPIGSALTSGNIIVGNSSNEAAAVSMSGDVTISNAGVTTIANDAITNSKMADNSVGNSELLDNAVNTAEIVNGAVTDVKLATDAVTNAKIQDGAVTGAKLENSGVTANTYGSATQVPVVTVDAKGRVTGVTNTTITGTSPIGSALTSGNIIVGNSSNEAAAVSMSGDVTITNAGVTTIANDAITNAKMADNSIGNAELLDNAVGTAEIVNGAVTSDKLANGAVIANKLSITDGRILVGTTGNVANEVLMSGDATINSSGVLTINTAAIGSDEIADGTILEIDITDGAITTNKLANNSITTAKIGDNQVTNAKLAGSIAGSKLTLTDGQIYVGNASNQAASVALSGDASITNTGALTVSRIQGIDVSTTDPTDNQVLAFNGTSWAPKTLGRSRVRAFRTTSDQSIPNNTLTKIDFNDEIYDTNGDFASGTFTAPVSGYYQVNSRVRFNVTGSSSVFDAYAVIMIYKNGNVHSSGSRMAITQDQEELLTNQGYVVSDIVYLNVNDTVDIRFQHDYGSALNVFTGSAETYVSIHLLSE